MSIIALMGAGGKMGLRVTRRLKDNPDHTTLYVEVSPAGQANLAELGVSVTPQGEALERAEVVILAVPDTLIGKICDEIVPKLRSGTMVIGLDAAAAYAGVLPERKDISYFITHPCHPPIFNDEIDPEARQDWFGGIAKQNIICALHQGPEQDYAKGETIARVIFAPVIKAHRLTVEQMAILEPALVETLNYTSLLVLREGMEETIRMGVPKEAAWDFLLGHIRVSLAIVLGFADYTVSEGAKLASMQARKQIFQPDWKNIFQIENVKKSVKMITQKATKD